MDLRTQLQSAVGSTYHLERELGGGGMSRVFVAEELALGRRVVVKVLAPDLVAGVNVERFRREIQVAARLQHAHIVPVLAAGELEGVPYYTMPFVDGESLRERVARAGALPIAETVGILRDVARALAYAHEHGVVHRDIKPDNVLVAGGSAVVTDFGIAKALSAARTDARHPTLTQVGISLGTPAYMAPEQAAADPATDHRADLYSFGILAYELVTGRPPFVAASPQKLLAMQMGEAPRPVGELRPDTPPALATLIMACLEKEPARRPQQARELVRVLDDVASPAATPPLSALLVGGRGALWRVLALYAAAYATVSLVTKAAVVVVGLPDWVFPGVLIVMAFGLPVILFTAWVHHVVRAAATITPKHTPGGTPALAPRSTMATLAVRAGPHVSWRRAALAGVAGVAGFAVVVALYMTLRALGIGPAGSLLAAGTLQPNERLLLDDFDSPSDTSLGPVVTEAFRAGLGESQSVSLVEPAEVREVLRRMERPVGSRVDPQLGREIAAREGLKAVVDGSILSLGGRYQIVVRLVNAQSGDALASYSAVASSEAEILPTIDDLTKELRARMGESLRRVQATKPLEQVTTSSLEALRRYVAAVHALEVDGDLSKGTRLLDESIALDTAFAMAYRKYAMELTNRPGQQARVMELLDKAYAHRDRLGDAERYLTVAAYYDRGPHADVAKAAEAYEAALDLQPDNGTALNNLGLDYLFGHDFVKARTALLRAVALPSSPAQTFSNLAFVDYRLRNMPETMRMVAELRRRFPANPLVSQREASLASALGQYDSARVLLEEMRQQHASDPATRAVAAQGLAGLAEVRGRLAEARQWRAVMLDAQRERGVPSAGLDAALDSAFVITWYLGDSSGAFHAVEGALARTPLDSLAVPDRPYARLVRVLAAAGHAERARAVAAAFERSRASMQAFDDQGARHAMRGDIALAEHRYADAVREYQQEDSVGCMMCALPRLAYAYDLAGNADSALAVFRRYVDEPWMDRVVGFVGTVDPIYLAGAYRRLGELYEQKGDRADAKAFYSRFIALWKNADPQLQPMVSLVRARLARLSEQGPG